MAALPGGIFLPILALGSLLGAAIGAFVEAGFITPEQFNLYHFGNEWSILALFLGSTNGYDSRDGDGGRYP